MLTRNAARAVELQARLQGTLQVHARVLLMRHSTRKPRAKRWCVGEAELQIATTELQTATTQLQSLGQTKAERGELQDTQAKLGAAEAAVKTARKEMRRILEETAAISAPDDSNTNRYAKYTV